MVYKNIWFIILSQYLVPWRLIIWIQCQFFVSLLQLLIFIGSCISSWQKFDAQGHQGILSIIYDTVVNSKESLLSSVTGMWMSGINEIV